MKQQNLYEQVISQKLNAVTVPGKENSWPTLEAKLEKLMPQTEKIEKGNGPRVLKTAALVAAGLFATAAGIYTLKFVSAKSDAATTGVELMRNVGLAK